MAIDVTWDDTGRKSNWPTATLEARVEEWREVYCHWVEGELFTSEAADAISSSAAAEASSEMRKLGTAELRTEPLAYFLDTETAYPAIVGPDGERRGTLEVSAVPCAKDGAPLGESAAVDDPRDALGKPLHFLVRIKRATGLPPHRHRDPRRSRSDRRRDPATDHGRGHGDPSRAIPRSPRAGMGNRARDAPSARRRRPRVQGLGEISRLSRRRRRRHRGGAAAALRYERTHSCPSVTSEILASLEEGRITFDVYVQQDGGAAARAPPSVARPSTADITRSRRRAREIEPPSLLPPERRSRRRRRRAAELAPVEEGNENEARDSDARSSSSSDASMASGSDDAFDRDAYEEYWDAEEAKHAAAMRSPFKIYPGWGGEAPGEGGDADEDEDEDADEDESDSDSEDEGAPARTGSVSEGIRFTNEGDALSEELGATALSTPPRSPVPVSRAPGASTPRAPSNTRVHARGMCDAVVHVPTATPPLALRQYTRGGLGRRRGPTEFAAAEKTRERVRTRRRRRASAGNRPPRDSGVVPPWAAAEAGEKTLVEDARATIWLGV